jgi:hypothetical protein
MLGQANDGSIELFRDERTSSWLNKPPISPVRTVARPMANGRGNATAAVNGTR